MYRNILTCCALAVAMACVSPLFAEQRPTVASWSFEGDLRDRSGRGNDAFSEAPVYAEGHSGQGLRCGEASVIVPDSSELRPAPGLRIECWAKLDAIGKSWQPLLIKNGGYQIRIDPPSEGGCFSFFLHLDGWEPRVRSSVVAEVGVWYHVLAGWDGKEIWIEVNGQRASRPRSGEPVASHEPLELGEFQGVLDEVRIENPGARFSGVAQWLFDGDLKDASKNGLHLKGEGVDFVAVPGGQALNSGSRKVQTANVPDLQLAPGLCIDCSVYFEQAPEGIRYIVFKDGEYQLRVNPPSEGGGFAFFVNLNGWEPRVSSDEQVVPGRWYRVTAKWDGFALTLDVNGRRTRVTRSGIPKPAGSPLVVGGFDGWIDNLSIENPRLPTLQVRDVRQEHAILCAGRPEKLTASIRNSGMDSEKVVVRLILPQGVRCQGDPVRELGSMAMGAEEVVEWAVQADQPQIGAAGFRVEATPSPPVTARHPLVFFSSEGGLPGLTAERISQSRAGAGTGVTYYIDSAAGNNALAGTSPDAPWKDFTNINGRTLEPGQRLLLKRGSIFNQELTIGARGTAENWAEIGTYGTGAATRDPAKLAY